MTIKEQAGSMLGYSEIVVCLESTQTYVTGKLDSLSFGDSAAYQLTDVQDGTTILQFTDKQITKTLPYVIFLA